LGDALLVRQAALANGLLIDLARFAEDGCRSAEVDVGRRGVAEALVVSSVVVVLDEGTDGLLEGAGQVVVLRQHAVLQRLAPALDPALGLRMVRRAADMSDAQVAQPVRQVARDVGRAIVAQ
jgi:hypothetical protein